MNPIVCPPLLDEKGSVFFLLDLSSSSTAPFSVLTSEHWCFDMSAPLPGSGRKMT